MIEQKRLQSHPHICTVPEEQKEKIMEIAMRAGHILLENGAEISRVEETIDRICRHYGIESANSFVLSNGIFSTMGNERESFFARVQHKAGQKSSCAVCQIAAQQIAERPASHRRSPDLNALSLSGHLFNIIQASPKLLYRMLSLFNLPGKLIYSRHTV